MVSLFLREAPFLLFFVIFTLSANCAYLKTNKSRKYNTPNSSFKTSKFHSEINLKQPVKQGLSISFFKALILH